MGVRGQMPLVGAPGAGRRICTGFGRAPRVDTGRGRVRIARGSQNREARKGPGGHSLLAVVGRGAERRMAHTRMRRTLGVAILFANAFAVHGVENGSGDASGDAGSGLMLPPPAPSRSPTITTAMTVNDESSYANNTMAMGGTIIFGLLVFWGFFVVCTRYINGGCQPPLPAESADVEQAGGESFQKSSLGEGSPKQDAVEAAIAAWSAAPFTLRAFSMQPRPTSQSTIPQPVPVDGASLVDHVFLSVERGYSGKASAREIEGAMRAVGLNREVVRSLMDACERTPDDDVTRQALHEARALVPIPDGLSIPSSSVVSNRKPPDAMAPMSVLRLAEERFAQSAASANGSSSGGSRAGEGQQQLGSAGAAPKRIPPQSSGGSSSSSSDAAGLGASGGAILSDLPNSGKTAVRA